MLMNEWMMLVLMHMQMQSASITLGCYSLLLLYRLRPIDKLCAEVTKHLAPFASPFRSLVAHSLPPNIYRSSLSALLSHLPYLPCL